jgi:hypothetical protein
MDGFNETGINNLMNEDFRMFPNPISSVLMVETGLTKNASVQISNVIGVTVFIGQLKNGPLTIDTKDLPNGIYNITLLYDTISLTKKALIKK